MQEILHGIQTKKLLKGTIRSKGNGGTSCYVVVHTVEGQPRKSVTIDGILVAPYLLIEYVFCFIL